jgi:hypothetical protein
MFILNTSVKETTGNYFFTHSLSPPMVMVNCIVPGSLLQYIFSEPNFSSSLSITSRLGYKKKKQGVKEMKDKNHIMHWLRKSILATRSEISVPLVGLNSNPSSSS